MPANNTELEKRLWGAADELRANSKLKSSEYSVPVLGLIFLRFADRLECFGVVSLQLGGVVNARAVRTYFLGGTFGGLACIPVKVGKKLPTFLWPTRCGFLPVLAHPLPGVRLLKLQEVYGDTSPLA